MNRKIRLAAAAAACFMTVGLDARADSYAYRVEYLESTPNGGQYIDTGVVPTTYLTFKATYEYVAFGNGKSASLDMIAGRQSSAGNYYPVSLFSTTLNAERYVCKSTKTKTHATTTKRSIIFNDKDRKVIVDDEVIGTFDDSAVLGDADTASCFLFATRVASGTRGPGWHSAARIYSCEFIDNSGDKPVTLRRFIPVVDLNGRPAMFDEEGKKLYYNQNANGKEFKVGPAIVNRKASPHFVEYLESDGKQWINTEQLVTDTTQTRVGYRYTDETQSSWAMICGVNGNRYYPVSVDGSNGLKERYCFAKGSDDVSVLYSALQRHELTFNKAFGSDKRNVFVDGAWLKNFTGQLTSSTYPLYAFAAVDNSNGAMTFPSKARIWHLEILENETLEKAFVPAVDANGVACMYDRKNGKYHYNCAAKDAAGAELYPFRTGRIISPGVSFDLSAESEDDQLVRAVAVFSTRPSYGTVFTLDATTAAKYDLAVRSDCVLLVDKDLSVASTAVWTGLGVAGDVTDANNWECRNAEGETIGGVLPSDRTVITVTGSTSIPLTADAMPECASIVLSGTITLTADCDWRGLGTLVIPGGVTINLNGYNLQLAGFTTLGDETATITDSTAGNGELHVYVAENDVLLNENVVFTGSLKFVKEGAGGFVAQRKNQTYTGGTKVACGTLRRGDYKGNYANESTAKDVGLGTSTFEISEGAIYDIDGAHTTDFIYTLDGGTLHNSRNNINDGNRYCGATVNLTKSSVVSGEQFGFQRQGYNPVSVNMNGNTLTVDMNSGKQFWLNNVTFSGGGTLDVISGDLTTLLYGTHVNTGSDLVLNVGSAAGLVLNAPLTVKDFNSASSSYSGDSTLTVLGTFKASGAGLSAFPKIVLADGATIDVSELDDTLALGGRIAFADGAKTIKVELGERKATHNTPVVSWTGTPANMSGVSFVNATTGERLSRHSDGVYGLSGLMIIFR